MRGVFFSHCHVVTFFNESYAPAATCSISYSLFYIIYISILNISSYSYLCQVLRGIHPSYENLDRKYPVEDQRTLKRLQSTCSILAHWSPIFGEVSLSAMNGYQSSSLID